MWQAKATAVWITGHAHLHKTTVLQLYDGTIDYLIHSNPWDLHHTQLKGCLLWFRYTTILSSGPLCMVSRT